MIDETHLWQEDFVVDGRRRYQRCSGCGQWRPWRGSLVFMHEAAQFELPICSSACAQRVDPYDSYSRPIPERVAAMLAALEPAAG